MVGDKRPMTPGNETPSPHPAGGWVVKGGLDEGFVKLQTQGND